MRRRQSFRDSRRAAYTLIELLVAISVIAAIMAVLLPAVQKSRETARRAQCASRLHNVGIAIGVYAEGNDDAIPYLAREFAAGSSVPPRHSWAAEILPYLDGQGIYDVMAAYQGIEPSGPFPADGYPVVGVLTCPSDPLNERPGRLSYVANAGYIRGDLWADNEEHHAQQINWDRNCPCPVPIFLTKTDRPYAYATGVFWRELPDDDVRHRFRKISDGLANTFMVTENLQAGAYNNATTSRIGFGVSISVDRTIAAWHVSTVGVGECFGASECECRKGANLALLPTFSLHDQENDNNGRINANLGGQIGKHPRPSSLHARGVNMLWCDGHITFVSQSIDDFVYARLITPAGEHYAQVVAQAPD